MARAPRKTIIGKVYKTASKAINNRYVKNKPIQNIRNIVSDVNMMKKMLNVEKKHITIFRKSQPVGQVNGLISGLNATDITPIIPQGITAETRNGNSVKLVSSYIQFQFFHQANTQAQIKGQIWIFKAAGRFNRIPFDSAAEVWKFNPFIGDGTNNGSNVIDINSQRNPDFFRDFILVRKKNFTVKMDGITGQQQVSNVNIPLKYKNHHVRYDNNSDIPTAGQIYLFILLDNGNLATLVSGCTGIPTTTGLTGLIFNMNCQHYYIDN